MTISTLGIIGSGQLGSLLCQAAKKLNIKTIVISDDENGPAQNYSGEFIYSQYDNKEKIKEFVRKVDIITYEFENIPKVCVILIGFSSFFSDSWHRLELITFKFVTMGFNF